MQGKFGLDSDNDGLTDYLEHYKYNTNPLIWDTDGDGFSDGAEISSGTDPLNPNSYPRAHSQAIPGFELHYILLIILLSLGFSIYKIKKVNKYKPDIFKKLLYLT